MKLVLFFIVSICFPKSQEYKLSCFGIHIADIKQSIYEADEIKYEIQSRGIADLIWPTNNNYYTSFDSATFSMKSWSKNVKQGIYKSSLDAKVNPVDNVLKYGEKSIQTVEPIYTIFKMSDNSLILVLRIYCSGVETDSTNKAGVFKSRP